LWQSRVSSWHNLSRRNFQFLGFGYAAKHPLSTCLNSIVITNTTPAKYHIQIASMGFTDFVSETGLTRTCSPSQCNSALQLEV